MNPPQILLLEAGLLQIVTPVCLGLAAAQEPDIEGLALQGQGQGRDVELRIMEQHDHGPTGPQILGLKDVLRPAKPQFGTREALLPYERASRIADDHAETGHPSNLGQ